MENIERFLERALESGTAEGKMVGEFIRDVMGDGADPDLVITAILEIRGWATAALNATLPTEQKRKYLEYAQRNFATDDVCVSDGAWVDVVDNGAWVETMMFVPEDK